MLGVRDACSHVGMRVQVAGASPGSGAPCTQQTAIKWTLCAHSNGTSSLREHAGSWQGDGWLACRVSGSAPHTNQPPRGLRATGRAWDLPEKGCACAHGPVCLCGGGGTPVLTPAAVFTGQGGGKTIGACSCQIGSVDRDQRSSPPALRCRLERTASPPASPSTLQTGLIQ